MPGKRARPVRRGAVGKGSAPLVPRRRPTLLYARFCERPGVRFPRPTLPIVVTLLLRAVVRRAGIDAVREHWPGTDDGFITLCRITGLASAAS
jgi:hypothetical protein